MLCARRARAPAAEARSVRRTEAHLRPLREWPGSRVAAVWVVWPALLLAAAFGLALIALWLAPSSRPGGPGAITAWMRLDLVGVLRLSAVVFGPPAMLTLVWAYARRRNHGDPSA